MMNAVPEVAAKSKGMPLARVAIAVVAVALVGLVAWLAMRSPATPPTITGAMYPVSMAR